MVNTCNYVATGESKYEPTERDMTATQAGTSTAKSGRYAFFARFRNTLTAL